MNKHLMVHCMKCKLPVDCWEDRVEIVLKTKKSQEHHLAYSAWVSKKIGTYHKLCYDKVTFK
jgi:hypothetical protein